jgi:hypothetical protein
VLFSDLPENQNPKRQIDSLSRPHGGASSDNSIRDVLVELRDMRLPWWIEVGCIVLDIR